jgi:enoyl-CoA hydratase/carnithine racemase
MAETQPVLLVERQGDLLILTLNRPEKHNALSGELSHLIGDSVSRAEEEGIKVIVITGAGQKAFCAGADMVELSGVENRSANLPPPDQRKDAFSEIRTTPLPVIAAINGYCYGGGVLIAIECDIRLASDTSSYRFPGAEYGLVVGASTLPRLVGAAKAKEWILTTRKIDAEEARAEGLVNHLYPGEHLLQEALAMAEMIAGHSTDAVRKSKQVIDAATLDPGATKIEAEANRSLRGTEEQTERFRSATQRVTGR